MKATNAQGPARAGNPAEPNGTRKRSGARTSPQAGTAPDPEKLAGFAPVPDPSREAPVWPVHLVVWLQPELKPAPPASSGLAIERIYKVPTPDFVRLDVAAAAGRPPIEQVCDPLPPALPRQIPLGDLAPLGWDPRAVPAPKGGER